MPRFEPFAGLRYATDRVRLDDVIAPPYDVISPDDQQELERRSEYNAVRIELPRPPGRPGLDRYQAAAQLLAQWQREGVVVADTEPGFYGNRMLFFDDADQPRHSVGVIGALGLEPPGSGGIQPHERTTPKAKSDRLRLLRATATNVSPIWGISLATDLSALLAVPEDVPWRATDADGVIHELWRIDDPAQVGAISRAVGSAPVVIADGHHRYETALAYQRERRAAAGERPGDYDLVMAFVVELAEDQLSVQAIHRLINGLPPDFDLLGALQTSFVITPTGPPDASIGARMQAAGALALVTTDGTWLLTPRADVSAAAGMDLDSSRLDVALTGLPPHDVTYQHGSDLAVAAVRKGDAQAGVLLQPAAIAQIAATGRGGERMPPKTTFFWPKPRTGLVFRELRA